MSDLTRREQLLLRVIAREIQHQFRMHELEHHSELRSKKDIMDDLDRLTEEGESDAATG